MEKPRRRPLTRFLEQPWPFLYSAQAGQLYRNVPAPKVERKRLKRPVKDA